jgi:hypothetical protein
VTPGASDATTDSTNSRDVLPEMSTGVMRGRFSKRGEWIGAILAFALTAAASFTIPVALDSKQPADVAVVHAAIPQVPLQLRVGPDANGLRLSWNPDAAQAGSAGVLQIRDGENSATQVLDAGQVAGGWFIYKPATRDVAFQLSLQSGERPVQTTLQVPGEMLPNQENTRKPRVAAEDEASAYDETPRKGRPAVSANEAGAYDATAGESNRDRANSQRRTVNGYSAPAASGTPAKSGPADTNPPESRH